MGLLNTKLQDGIRLVWARVTQPSLRTLILLGLIVSTRAVIAQDVLAPLPQYPFTPPAVQQAQTDQMTVFQPVDQLPPLPSGTQPFQWGPVTLRPYITYQFLYGDGLQASPGQSGKTAIQQIAPGISLSIGNHWSLNYSPFWTLYSNKLYGDAFGQTVSLAGGTTYGDWVLGLSLSYGDSFQTLVQTGGQTRQETMSTALTASYHFSRQMTLELAVNQSFDFPENYVGNRQWSTLDWLDYQFAPRFSAAIGAGIGYTDVSAGSNLLDEQLQGRINWRATDKISIQFRAGLQDTQFLGSSNGDLITPIFGAGLQYQPFVNTMFSLNANRTVSPSYYSDQVTETTGFFGNFTQRLLQRYYLSLSGGYSNSKYITNASGFPVGRTDETYSFNVRLSTSFLKRGTIAALYQFSDNLSNQSGYGYTSNQFGFEVGFRY